MKKWTDDEKKEIIDRCTSARENGELVKDILRESGITSGQLCQWRKKYSGESEIKQVIFEEFRLYEKEEITESGRINIQYGDARDEVVTILFSEGYVIWLTVEDEKYYINYQR
jgi:transposase-like protein